MRNVEHLLGVEFLHDLYNRYNPQINAYRFRHTIVTWKDGIANAYAPQEEWDSLAEIVGEKYYNLDKFTLYGTRKLYARKREYYWKFMGYLKKRDLTKLTNQELSNLLTDFESIVLGELYVLNFVQVECGLTVAIKRILKERLGETRAEDAFATLIHTEVLTASEQERQHLHAIVRKWRRLKKLKLYTIDRALKDARRHYDTYSHLFCAYGESPKRLEDFLESFTTLLGSEEPLPPRPLFHPLLSPCAKKKLKELGNSKLNKLVPLLVKGGIFRDTNKALLGQSLRYRFAMLDEVAARGLEKRENLNFYLLIELFALLNHGKKLDIATIITRRTMGMRLSRAEDVMILENETKSEVKIEQQKILKGTCASRGESTGICRVVLRKEDAQKVKAGDIMVAIGTDFDLLDAMHRSSAVVTEEGGILSHASVVCREMKKPCCIGVPNATTLLTDGTRVRVDASNGIIHLLDRT